MEARLGADFSDVRIHDDSAARDSAAEVGARAYTSGSHVVIGEGGGDKHTLAHELTHVIQQRQGAVAGTDRGDGLKVSDPSDRFEREAEANARRVLAAPQPAREDGSGDPSTRTSSMQSTADAVQRVVGQGSNSTDGVFHLQGEHIFNNVGGYVTQFEAAVTDLRRAARDHVLASPYPKWKKRLAADQVTRMGTLVARLNGAAANLTGLRAREEFATATRGDGDNAGAFGEFTREITTLLNDCSPANVFQTFNRPRTVAMMRTQVEATIIDLVAKNSRFNDFRRLPRKQREFNDWFAETQTAMLAAFATIFDVVTAAQDFKDALNREDPPVAPEAANQ